MSGQYVMPCDFKGLFISEFISFLSSFSYFPSVSVSCIKFSCIEFPALVIVTFFLFYFAT